MNGASISSLPWPLGCLVAGLAIFFVVLLSLGFKRLCRRVEADSGRLTALKTLNKNTHFDTGLKSTYYLTARLNSKGQYDALELSKYAANQIRENMNHYAELIRRVKTNYGKYQQYCKDIEALPVRVAKGEYSGKVPLWMYRLLEGWLYRKNILPSPIVAPVFLLRKTYTSPKGRRHYAYEKKFSFFVIENLYAQEVEKNRMREQAQQERKALTHSLRYEILKRDNFRCVICGRGAKDGVTLHVDHKKPVSKGGLTTPDNLRTLCDSCNRGKSDKYDEHGLN